MKKLSRLLVGMAIVTGSGVGCGHTAKQAAIHHTDTVFISGMQFHPAVSAVKAGDTILWVNEDLVVHDVTAYPNKNWTSDSIAPNGGKWKKVIDKGFRYFCSIHPTMKGEIKVVPSE